MKTYSVFRNPDYLDNQWIPDLTNPNNLDFGNPDILTSSLQWISAGYIGIYFMNKNSTKY